MALSWSCSTCARFGNGNATPACRIRFPTTILAKSLRPAFLTSCTEIFPLSKLAFAV